MTGTAHIPAVGETYRWAGKTWKVVAVDAPHQRATVENVARRSNTATMPFAQFQPMEVDPSFGSQYDDSEES